MKELSLFSGAGGGLLAMKWFLGWQCLGYVEWDEYCCKVLEQRIKDGFLDEAPIFQMDIREFNRRIAPKYRGVVDVITAGFPCQPFSVAGRQKGKTDDRNMWPSTIDCIRIVEPRFILLENVPGLLVHEYFGQILGDLAESGFDVFWKVVSAAEVGATHRRDRLWIVANTKSKYRNDLSIKSGGQMYKQGFWGIQSRGSPNKNPFRVGGEPKWIIHESELGRVAHGVAHRVDRLKALGNGQVPKVVEVVWRLLNG